ncbi:polyketide synthase [Hypomontagnella monticulosa]|nr:polyketide synthase [Hypomontagnella monticulosa]
MPHFKESSSSSASDVELEFEVGFNAQGTNAQGIVSDEAYVAAGFGTEAPLSQQLEPIAVIGMGCRLPGDVKSASEFWDMMMNKKTGQTPQVPESRFNIGAHFHENNDRPGSFGVLGGYFLQETLQEFDPNFFGITPVEAMWMDPQQRKLLEVVYEAFESAGATLEQLSGSDTACFMATFTADFQQMSFKEHSFRHSLAATGVDPGLLSNRVSHVFNLRGPSIVVNTACSSSVYAIHNACNALRSKECGAAVVGGSNLVLTVDQHMNTAKLGVLSPTSTCHTFNSYANGYGRAEGVGAVYLKRLSDAIRDGDPIRGVIRSSATNSNGKAPGVGITYPGFDGQRAVMKHAYRRCGTLDPRLTGYFECHGTGTAIGDPLEVNAVADSMNYSRTAADGPLHIGAVKTNIGHSEAASGLSAVIKAVLAVERGIIPPTRGVTDLNPKIDWEGWQVKVVTDPMAFPAHLPVHRVSVNSFGYGGTNAHVIVESPKSLLTQPQSYKFNSGEKKHKGKSARGRFNRNRPHLLVFSAHEKSALKRNIAAHGQVAANYDLLDLSYTLANRRTHFSSRGMVVSSLANLSKAFSSEEDWKFAEKKAGSSNESNLIGMAFTGQGAQWARMGAGLMAYYPTFLKTIQQLDMALDDLDDAPNWTIEDVLLEPEATSRVSEAEFSQPLCTAVQIGLVQLLRLWGIKPAVTCGHSSGEIGAAYAAGYLTATEAIVLAYYRGKTVRDINTNGAMMAVGLGAEAVSPYLESYDDITIACHNSPSGVTLSGDAESLKKLQETFNDKAIFARIVKTGGKAYHSYHMKPAAETYESYVRSAGLNIGAKNRPVLEKAKMVSSVTNAVLPEDAVLDEKYWSANLLNPVLFNQAVQTIANTPELADITMIEVGPHSALSGPIKQIKAEFKFEKLKYLPTLLRGADCATSMLKLAGELWLAGYPLDLARATSIEEMSPSGKIRARGGNFIVDLPPYQWDKTKKFWAESRESREHRNPKYARHDVLGELIVGCSLAEPTWRNIFRIRDMPWLKDHSLGGEAVFPAAGYFSMAIEAITQINELSENPVSPECYVLRDVSIQQALVTPDDDNGVEVLLNMRPSLHGAGEGQNKWWEFNVSSITEDGFKKNHMSGRVGINMRKERPAIKPVPNLPQTASGKAWNHALKRVGFDYGPTFQDMDNITFDAKTYAAHSTTVVKQKVDSMVGESRYVLHPAALDSCLQLMIVAIWGGRTNAMKFGAVPVQADEIALWVPTEAQLENSAAKAFSWIDPRGARSFNAFNQLIASDGQLLMEINAMRCSAYEAALPPLSEEPAKPAPYARTQSKPDVALLSGAQKLSVADFVELVEFKKPGLKVLSVDGAYAESLVGKIPALSLTATYDVPDEEYEMSTELSGSKNVKAVKFDIGADLEGQAVAAKSFELVVSRIASPATLAKIQNLVAEGGRAIIESAAPLSEADLKTSGFSGAVTIEAPAGKHVTVVSAGSDAETKAAAGTKVQLIYRNNVTPAFSGVEKSLKGEGFEVEAVKFGTSTPVASNVVMLVDLEGPFLASISEKEFLDMQALLAAANNLLWVTRGGLVTSESPEYAMTSGLLRVLRSEQASLNATLIDFESEAPLSQFVDLTSTLATKKANGEELETEYFVSKGQVHITRLISDERINDVYAHDEEDVYSAPFDPAKRLVGKARTHEVVFESDNGSETDLEAEEIEIQVVATGLNKEDIAVISGTEFATDFSHEIAGIVTRVGSSVKDFAPSDRVVSFSANKFATFQRVNQSLVQKLNADESFTTMASLPISYGAALYGIENLAHLQQGESVLVLPGVGILSAAIIKVAKALGATPIVAARGAAEAEILAKLGLGSDQIIQWSTAALAKYQPDVVFSTGSVDSSVAREAWRHLPAFSRFVSCSGKEASSSNVLDIVPATRGASYLSFDVINLFKKPKILTQLLNRIVTLFRQGTISPLPVAVKNIAELNETIASFSDDLQSAKTVILNEASSGTITLVPSRPHARLDPNATYFLVGCLGGLGRSLTSWMLKRGARNFAFLSRSGTDSKQAAILVENLRAAGANVQVFRGDASKKEDVEKAVKEVPADRPIKGVINAAMVLRDGMFHNMTFDSWVTSTNPKVHGSANLHEVMKDLDLDFFVMTSSVSGTLGTPGQSNYAAGNAYMDALARLRHTQGKRAAAIVLPMILGIGVVAENASIEEALKRKGMYGVDEYGVLDSFEVAILEQTNPDAKDFDHLVVGLDPSLLRKAKSEAEGDVDVFWAVDPRFSSLLHAMETGSGDEVGGGADSVLSRVKAAATAAEAIDAVQEHFIGKLSRLLMLDVEEFEGEGRSVASFGIDSMIGAELRNWIFKELGLDIAFQQLLGPSLTIRKFSELVVANQGIQIE